MPALILPPAQSGGHVLLVDGSAYMYRAYHALPPISRKSDGLQLNAVVGFCAMIWKLLCDLEPGAKPTHFGIVFDKSRVTFRTALYPDYQAGRPETPEDLRSQLGLVREAVRAFNIACLEQQDFEADDLIATYTRQACEAGFTVTIVSSDKDLMQLINERVVLYDTMRDRRVGRLEVMEKFGVPPEQVVDVQALMGDPTDNVPGVPGIGVKTAARLITEYGDLETLLSRANEIKQEKVRLTIVTHADKARLSRKLVTLNDHVKLEIPISALAFCDPDYRRLIGFLKAMELDTLTRRVSVASGINAATIEPDMRLRAHSQGNVGLTPQRDSHVRQRTGGESSSAQGELFPEETRGVNQHS
jgi:DNA polymerase I